MMKRNIAGIVPHSDCCFPDKEELVLCRKCGEWTSKVDGCCEQDDSGLHDCGCPKCVDYCASLGCDECIETFNKWGMPA